MAELRKNSFGSISGMVTVVNPLGFQLEQDVPKTILNIDASFRVVNGASLASMPFLQGVVAVFAGTLDDFPFSSNLYQIEKNQSLKYLKFFNQYQGISESVYIPFDRSEKVSVVLLPPILATDTTQPTSCFGTLNVYGTFGNDKELFSVSTR